MTEKDVKYEKSELIKSGRWNRFRLSALLDDDKTYSIKEVEQLLKKEGK